MKPPSPWIARGCMAVLLLFAFVRRLFDPSYDLTPLIDLALVSLLLWSTDKRFR